MFTINSTATLLSAAIGDAEVIDTTVETITMTDTESAAALIEDFGGIEEVRRDTYDRLHTLCAAAVTFDGAAKLLDDAEILFINNNFSEAERLKESTKAGKIKRTKFLPNDYMSAKSVLLGALEGGINLFDEEGNPLGKSALSDKKTGKTEKTPEMKLNETLARALKLAREVYGTDVTDILVCANGTVFQSVKA